MSFPTTVLTQATVAEAPGVYGPFVHGTDLYVVNVLIADDMNAYLILLKSADQGDTWTEVDEADRPQVLISDSPYTVIESGTVGILYVVYLDSSAETAVQQIDLATDSWGAVLGTTGDQFYGAACYRSSDNSLIVTFITTVDTLGSNTHNIPGFKVFDISGMSFGDLVAFDYEDYDEITVWNQQVCGLWCGSDGIVHAFMQQITSPPNPDEQTESFSVGGSYDFDIPFDCTAIYNVQVFGAGGGGAMREGVGNGGGGGGGYSFSTGPFSTVPGNTLSLIVGTGGAAGDSGTAGGNSSIESVTAGGGGGGTPNGSGGAGGSGDTFSGGKGGNAAAEGGGGGGGGADLTDGHNGTDGQNGSVFVQPAGGTIGGGEGGSGGALLNPNGDDGLGGSDVSGGGGGGGSCGDIGSTGGNGGDGYIQFNYQPSTSLTSQGRIWQQAILSDNSLGTLTLIDDSEFPLGNGPVQFDSKVGSGFFAICISGVTSTGLTRIMVGRAENGSVLDFDFQSFSTGGNYPATAGLALDGTTVYCAYIKVPALNDVSFVYRIDSGSGFSAEIAIGDFLDVGCRQQIGFLSGSLIAGTFGTATQASADFGAAESDAELLVTANEAGVDGNLILVVVTPVEDGGAAVVNVTHSDINQHKIEVIYGFTPDPPVLQGDSDWAAIATKVNVAAGSIVTATGSSSDEATLAGITQMTGGSSGQGIA